MLFILILLFAKHFGVCTFLNSKDLCVRDVRCQWTDGTGCANDETCFDYLPKNDTSTVCKPDCSTASTVWGARICFNTTYHSSVLTGGVDSCSYKYWTQGVDSASECLAPLCADYDGECLDAGLDYDGTAWYIFARPIEVQYGGCSDLVGEYLDFCNHFPSCIMDGDTCKADLCFTDGFARTPLLCKEGCKKAMWQGFSGCIDSSKDYDGCFDMRPIRGIKKLNCPSNCHNYTIDIKSLREPAYACLNVGGGGGGDDNNDNGKKKSRLPLWGLIAIIAGSVLAVVVVVVLIVIVVWKKVKGPSGGGAESYGHYSKEMKAKKMGKKKEGN